jgi:uncharacterized protein (DUF1800 family)
MRVNAARPATLSFPMRGAVGAPGARLGEYTMAPPRMAVSTIVRFAALAVCALVLSACGGGGGGSSSSGSPGGGPVTPPTPPRPPPPPIGKTDAFRFLAQATYGPTEAEVQRLIALGDSTTGYAKWIDEQLQQPASVQLPTIQTAYAGLTNPAQMIGSLNTDRQEIWFRNSITGPDQLRQRVAFALSEVMVVSQQSTLQNMPHALADYYDMLARDAFGDFRKLIEDVTLHPAMGVYLNMLGNQKPDTAKNIRPDENYARELMQLFTVGLVELNADGTVKKDAQGQPVPTYDQSMIEGFANVFTGWNYSGAATFAQARRTLANQVLPMQAYPEQHSPLAKKLLQYPGATKATLPAGQTPQQDLADALDNIVNHPNVGPFIAKQLIQKLVTSNPSPQYVARVTAVFNNDGSGKRGNLGAVVKAILLDAEARPATPGATSGKVKEPLLRLTQMWRAYGAKAANGQYRVGNINAAFGQGPLQSPSVFNFFSPFYAPPGEISDQGLVAPEMQIATEYLNTTSGNTFYNLIFAWNSTATNPAATSVLLDYSAEVPLAGDSEALVSRIAEKMLGGQISATLKTEAKAAVERTAATNPGQRVSEALYLVATSPEYVVQR